MKDLDSLPVLKLPADLLIDVLVVLHRNELEPVSVKQTELLALRPAVGVRTLVNAYTIPSLHELKLYVGTLSTGSLTRFGHEIAASTALNKESALELTARHLLTIDKERVGMVAALVDTGNRGSMSRTQAANWFVQQYVHSPANDHTQHLDRLGKWIAYLLFFNVLRDESGKLTFDQRHIQALSTEADLMLSDEEIRQLVLDSYLLSSSRLGTKYYIPIDFLRDVIGGILSRRGIVLTDGAIDGIILKSVSLLSNHMHMVNFSPFSGPARYGLKLPNMFAGFITIRPK